MERWGVVSAVLMVLGGVSPAAADGVRVRVWGATRIEAAGRETADEAGAKWLEVGGRLTTERGEPVAGGVVRFERAGEERQVVSGGDGSFGIELRGGEGTWTARFDGGERLRPTATPVAAQPAEAEGRPWIVFVPLLALAAALVAAGAVLFKRRAAAFLGRLRDAWRRRASRVARRGGRASAAGAPGALGVVRVQVVDALRHRPLLGVRVEVSAGASVPPAVTGPDGLAELPTGAGSVVLRRAGYVPSVYAFTRGGPPGRTSGRKPHAATGAAAASPPDPPRIVSGKALDDAPLAPQRHGEGVNGCPSALTPGQVDGGTAPDDEPRREVVRLWRGRDAVVRWLERARGSGGGAAGRFETVGQMAVRVVGETDAARLEEICYGRARAPDVPACAILSMLHARAAAARVPSSEERPEPGSVIGALSGE